MKIEYSILTPSKIRVLTDDKRELFIYGEGTDEPKFYADSNSIKNWEHSNNNVTQEEKKIIVETIQKESKNKIPIVFD